MLCAAPPATADDPTADDPTADARRRARRILAIAQAVARGGGSPACTPSPATRGQWRTARERNWDRAPCAA